MKAAPVLSGRLQPSKVPSLPGPRYIIVGESASRRWIVKDNRGRLGAVFRAANVALRFARREATALGCGIVIDGSPVELDCLMPSSALG
jgi:hypothetical protein